MGVHTQGCSEAHRQKPLSISIFLYFDFTKRFGEVTAYFGDWILGLQFRVEGIRFRV
jgi:hypothetical protein